MCTRIKKALTIFTPSYNRAHTLSRTYESLCRQSCKDFVWLVIDDGSTDNTKELVESWQKKNDGFEIIYKYKENGGMHTAHNAAYRLIDTELNVCIDSDDCLAYGAVDKILNLWAKYGDEKYAGIIGLDADMNGDIIGDCMPENLKEVTLSELKNRYHCRGDKKLVYRTAIIKCVSEYPEFPGEKLVPLGYKYLLVDQKYPLLLLNDILCNVEYQIDGSSNTIIKQYLQSPRGFAEARKIEMIYSRSFKRQIMSSIHYVSSNIILKNYRFLNESPKKIMTFCAIPFGILLYIYIIMLVKLKNRRNGND